MENKIYEEVIVSMINRIEKLEEFNKKYYEKQTIPTQYFNKTPGQATPGQIWRIKKDGGKYFEGMTKQEASNEIDRLSKPIVTDSHPESPITEPKEVDTDDAGIDSEGLL